MKYIRYVFVVALLLVLLPAKLAHADVNNFVVNSFDADYTLTAVDKQGELHVVENIDLTYSDNNHGILRAIPKKYKNNSLNPHVNSVTSPTGAPSTYSTYTQNDNLVLKIGSPSQTVTGNQKYTIDYTLQNVVTFYNDHDELYWDINGDQWGQPFTSVTARLHTPSGLLNGQLKCFTGTYGGTDQNCVISQQTNGDVVASTSGALGARQTLTVVVGFNKGVFAAATSSDFLREHWLWLVGALVPPFIIGPWAYWQWRKKGKDIKGRGTIIAEYAPPDNLSPAEVGMIYDYKLDTKDVSATIIDLAIKKHLMIIEQTEKKLLKDKTVYTFKRLASDTSTLRPHELLVLQAIFPTLAPNTEVKLDSLKNKFYISIKTLQKSVPQSLTVADYFDGDPTKAGNKMHIIGVLLLLLGWVLFGIGGIGLMISGAIVLAFASFMSKRSAKGVSAKEAIEGLKLYMNTAEKDRLAMLQSANAPYAQNASEPKRTADLFEKLLPYAIVLGVEQTWAKQFEGIYTTPPDWYSGNWQTFNAVYFASNLSNTIGAMATNFSPPSSSGSSGFGGGGFSGGGGGGGGGGGW